MVRTRFAPSPTGYLHVGGARTALFNYLYAKAHGGDFVLRIEDTDQERSTQKSETLMLESLSWLGLDWDEGLAREGSFGPYRQSDRLNIYREHVEKLIYTNHAYHCFCSTEELEEKKKQQEAMGVPSVYDGKCRGLRDKEISKCLEQEQSYVVRFRTPDQQIIVRDMIQGDVFFDASLIGDFIIVKSDGFPSYNFAVVVDDALMKISHVIRGVGHLSNTPRQIVIYNALSYIEPTWAHVSEIVGGDHKKLSKRHGATSIMLFRELGYIPKSFCNYIALLGWSPKTEQEFLSTTELSEMFDVVHCNKSPAMFDVFQMDKIKDLALNDLSVLEVYKYLLEKSKLNHLSNLHIRAMPEQDYLGLVVSYIHVVDVNSIDKVLLYYVCLHLRVYLNNFLDINKYIGTFFQEFTEGSLSVSAKEWLKEDDCLEILNFFLETMSELDSWDFLLISSNKDKMQELINRIKQKIKDCGNQLGYKGKKLFMTLRVGLTGKTEGIELPIYIFILGKQHSLKRLQVILKILS